MGGKQESHDEDFLIDDVEVEAEDETPRDALKKVREKLKACEAEKAHNLDGWQRAQADVVNVKREFAERETRAYKRGQSELVSAMAPALDSFHMAMQGKGWEDMPREWKVGIEGIYMQLTGVLKEQGLTIIDPLGQEFNPEEHESMSVEAVAEKAQDHQVVKTIQKGLKLDDHVIRPAKVVVGEYTPG